MITPKEQPLRFDDRAAFWAWAAAQPRGRWERCDGVVLGMVPERVRHTKIKYQIWEAIKRALAEANSPCEVLGDGITVEVDERTDYEPDVLVNCGERVEEEGVAAPNPVVIVEVLSQSTAHKDATQRLVDYFRLPSVQHYLLVSSQAARVVQHSRHGEGQLLTRLPSQNRITLDPPGITVSVADFYAGTDLALPGGA